MRCVAVSCVAVRCVAVSCGAVRCGVVRYGAVRCGLLAFFRVLLYQVHLGLRLERIGDGGTLEKRIYAASNETETIAQKM